MKAIELARTWGTVPRLHPNNFIYLDFPEESTERPEKSSRRLHIWPTERIPNGQSTSHPIHDHVFKMDSRILKGRMRHNTYNFVRSKFACPEYEIFRAVYTSRIEAHLETTGEYGHLVMLSSIDYPTGSSYGLLHEVMHSSQTFGLTVTVINKTYPANGKRCPRVAVPYGVKPDNEAKRDLNPPELLWNWIERGLEGLDEKTILG